VVRLEARAVEASGRAFGAAVKPNAGASRDGQGRPVESTADRQRVGWRSRGTIAALLFGGLLLAYNANGRETPTYDSQSAKFAARELALHGRLTLDGVIARAPGYADRAGFQRDVRGQYRSAYSPVPSILAAVPASLLHVTGLVDMRAPLAPALVAKLTASVLTAAAVTLAFLAVVPAFGLWPAFWTAVGLGLGTNLWPLASGTLWQMDTVAFGLALALFCWFRPSASLTSRHVVYGALGLALAASTRPQDGLLVGVVAAGLVARIGWSRGVSALVVLGVVAGASIAYNYYAFGRMLGGAWALQEAARGIHGVSGDVTGRPWIAAAGLLVSPNRGLIVFSPVVLVALAGITRLRRLGPGWGEWWWLAAALAQFLVYSCYSVWWGGHTYGPRYLVDVLVPLAPAAAAGVAWMRTSRWRTGVALVLLGGSVAVAATGAFVYPAEGWNGDPDVNRHHERVWDWSDTQVVRCWRTGPSPQNFSLIDRYAVRRPPGPVRWP
jgi:hypothetical protein